jgi:hypothetical protein
VAVMIAIIGILAFGALIVTSWRGRDHGEQRRSLHKPTASSKAR